MKRFKVGDIIYVDSCGIDMDYIATELNFSNGKHASVFFDKFATIQIVIDDSILFDYSVYLFDEFGNKRCCSLPEKYVKRMVQKSRIIKR